MANDESEEREEKNAGPGGERKSSKKLWTPHSDEEAAAPEPAAGEEEIPDEELRKRIEEALERITVADVVLDMTISLSSLAYQRMGIPPDVNAKFRDMEQARLAIDCVDALVAALTERVPPEVLEPLRGTLDNLKLNFVKESE